MQVEWNWNVFSMYICNHFMMKEIPICETRQILKHLFSSCMENMWSIYMNENTMFILFVITISCNVILLFQNQYFFVLLFWQVYTTRLGRGHIILVPTPEAVFSVFYTMRERMILGVFSSLSLLLIGFGVSLPLGVALGLIAGWNSRLRDTVVPIARVLSPIPAIIYAPYLIAIMPSFRSASAMVLIIGIFWPTFLQMVARVGALDQRILDSARVLGLKQRELLWEVLLPWVMPGILTGLRGSLSSAFMLLTLAEMMGAHSGLGYFIRNFADYANYTNVLAGILLVALVITLLNRAVTALETRLVRWH